MYERIRPLLFRLDPERIHHLILIMLRVGGNLAPVRKFLRAIYLSEGARPVDFAGLRFPNAVGLAAGYDKDGIAWRGLSCLGFGHLELGTVTPRAQPGNPKPRIFRIPSNEAIINRMGFPGKGSVYAASRIPEPGSSPERDGIILGINIGKNKDTPIDLAVEDYLSCLQVFAKKVDYFAVNVSSPNTIGLRQLQGKEYLNDLLQQLIAERNRLKGYINRPLPIFIKIAPDLSDPELSDVLEAITLSSADGVIATNTTIQRESLLGSDPNIPGGLSGRPLKDLSSSLIRKIHQWTAGKLPIIGVGGIGSVTDAREKLDAGAGLVQVYSGMIYRGPRLVQELVESL